MTTRTGILQFPHEFVLMKNLLWIEARIRPFMHKVIEYLPWAHIFPSALHRLIHLLVTTNLWKEALILSPFQTWKNQGPSKLTWQKHTVKAGIRVLAVCLRSPRSCFTNTYRQMLGNCWDCHSSAWLLVGVGVGASGRAAQSKRCLILRKCQYNPCEQWLAFTKLSGKKHLKKKKCAYL